MLGAIITLGIGKMELDWSKNFISKDHSVLFQLSDVGNIPYYYSHPTEDKVTVEYKEGYSRRLSSIKRRLDLLGYDMDSIKEMYDFSAKEHIRYGYQSPITFGEYVNIFVNLDIRQSNTADIEIYYYENGFDLGEYAKRCILDLPYIQSEIKKICDAQELDFRDFCYDLSVFLENLDSYILLRVLCENPLNDDLKVYWGYADAVDENYVDKNEIVKPLEADKKILIVTEGSSDSLVLKKTIEVMYPDISDFFSFVDMKDNYPFTGTGSLYNFCIGLCRINIRNNVIVIFDNDTAGIEKYQQAQLLSTPHNLLITKLPNHECFCNVLTKGPHGETYENINSRAVAIECFLDFKSTNIEPCIRWTTFNRNRNEYQGELARKDEYVRSFIHSNLSDGSYDVSKLRYLIDYLINQWIHR